MNTKLVRVTEQTHNKLRKRAEYGDSMDTVIVRLLENKN